MRETDKVALVIPALREAHNLRDLLGRVRSALAGVAIDWEVIVVDDDSGDGSEQIVAEVAREDPRVRLLIRRGERGLSGAVLHGWRHTDAGILGVMDADGQHPPESLPRLIAAIAKGNDLAIGSRYAGGGSRGGNPIRRLASIAAILAARPLQSNWPRVRDPLSGFFIVRRGCVEGVAFQTAGFKLLLEILVRGRIESIEEVPFAFGKRWAGRSKLSLRVAWGYLLLLGRLLREKYGLMRVAQQAPGD
jgi:dolichol-phosphate mannosyltransferase